MRCQCGEELDKNGECPESRNDVSPVLGETLACLAMGILPVEEEQAVRQIIATDATAAHAFVELSELIAHDDEDEPMTPAEEQTMNEALARVEANLKRMMAEGR